MAEAIPWNREKKKKQKKDWPRSTIRIAKRGEAERKVVKRLKKIPPPPIGGLGKKKGNSRHNAPFITCK